MVRYRAVRCHCLRTWGSADGTTGGCGAEALIQVMLYDIGSDGVGHLGPHRCAPREAPPSLGDWITLGTTPKPCDDQNSAARASRVRRTVHGRVSCCGMCMDERGRHP